MFSEFQAFVVQPVDDRWDQNEFKWSDVVVNSKYIAVSASKSGKELKLILLFCEGEHKKFMLKQKFFPINETFTLTILFQTLTYWT